MTDHLLHSRKYFRAFLCLLFFAAILLTFPIQTIAQTRSSQRERRVQIFFAYNPTRPAAGQEIQFQDFSRGNPSSWLWDFGDGQTSILQNPRHAFPTPGSYKVILTARNNTSSGKVSRTLNVILSISASFTYGPANPVTGQAVQFTDTSTGGPTSWQWNFGDGTSSTSQNPNHAYTTAGSYTVTLTVGFSSGSKTVSQAITVAPSLAASFIYSPNPPVAGQAVQFTDTSTGSPTSWQWSFGDGATSNSQNPSHIYATAASYTVTLTVVYSSGSKSVSQTIAVIPPPALSASFTYSPSSPVAGQAVQFTDTSTGNPTSWLWNFGDNTASTSKNPSHTFSTAASYTVTLTVANNSASKSVSQTINVLPASTLNASFTYNPSSPVAGQVVYFTDTSTGSPTSWQWNFGDSATSSAKNPSHAYTTAASYTVALTVTNSSGSQSTSQTVTVLPTFAASFTYSPSSPAVNQAVQFTDKSTGSPNAWQWNFGDSATSTIQNPSHTYTAVGQYWVNLIITKGADSHSVSQMITVREPGTITAASPSFADVSAAISAASSGYTVIVPAGTATWTSQLIIAKPISVIGAGVGNTVITSTFMGFFLKYAPPAGTTTLFRLSGFTFQHGSISSGFHLRNSNSLNPIRNVRIDHNSFLNTGGNPSFAIEGPVYGVIDNNTITGFSHMDNLGQGSCSDWIPPFELGTEDNLYWEDNNISVQDCISTGGHGGRYCYRYNTFTFSPTGSYGHYPAFDMHGNQGSGVIAPRGGEIYENTINVVGSHSGRMFDHRGGTMVIYNNYYHYSGYDYQIREEYCNSISCGGAYDMTVKGSYYWDNFNNGVLFTIENAIISNSCGEYTLKEGQNFWIHRASFDGKVGMGVGPLTSRPSSGLVAGVGYWATDEMKLYRATGPTTWGLYYTPYTYPHPLRNIR